MPYVGIPTFPWIVFRSGDLLIYVDDVPITKDGEQYRRVYMIPTEDVMWRYGIKDEELNFELSEYGVIIREYPDVHFEWVSQGKMIHMSCNFDGTSDYKNALTRMRNKLESAEHMLAIKESENQKLREQMKVSVERISAMEKKRLKE